MSGVSTLQEVPAILWAPTEFFHKVLEEPMACIRGSLSGQPDSPFSSGEEIEKYSAPPANRAELRDGATDRHFPEEKTGVHVPDEDWAFR
jgi:hypothetical protein